MTDKTALLALADKWDERVSSSEKDALNTGARLAYQTTASELREALAEQPAGVDVASADEVLAERGPAFMAAVEKRAAELAGNMQPAGAVVLDAMVVPYGSASGDKDYTYGYEKGYADGWNICRDRALALIDSAGGAKGGVE